MSPIPWHLLVFYAAASKGKKRRVYQVQNIEYRNRIDCILRLWISVSYRTRFFFDTHHYLSWVTSPNIRRCDGYISLAGGQVIYGDTNTHLYLSLSSEISSIMGWMISKFMEPVLATMASAFSRKTVAISMISSSIFSPFKRQRSEGAHA